MRHPRSTTGLRRRGGFILLAVLVVVVLLALAAYQFSDLMSAEYRVADSYRKSVQAKALADSGVAYAAALLSNPDAFANTLGSNPFDNPQAFQGIEVNISGLRGRFSIVALVDPNDPNAPPQGFRYGVEDESGKINVNALFQIDSSGQILQNMLLKLPLGAGMVTQDITDPILDWMDTDDEPRQSGVEDMFYQTLSPPYHTKNGPLDSLEELLYVKGVTRQVLLGNDLNRNGVLDPDEDDGGLGGAVDRGLSTYLTILSREQNMSSSGTPRIYVNARDLDQLQQDLNNAVGSDLANFILAYRVYGPAGGSSLGGSGRSGRASSGSRGGTSSGSLGGASSADAEDAADGGPGESSGGGRTGSSGGSGASSGSFRNATSRLSSNDVNRRSSQPRSISSLFELINAKVDIPSQTPNAPPTRYPSPLSDPASIRQLMPTLLDMCTTSRGQEVAARINVNTAPQAVLAALPRLQDADIQNILDHRPDYSGGNSPDPIYQTVTWLVTEANIDPRTVQAVDKYITASSQVYRVQVIGYFDGGGPSARVEAVIDTNQGYPRILYRRDISELGRGFPLGPTTFGGNR